MDFNAWTELANRALTDIEVDEIADLADPESEPARVVRTRLEGVVKAVLRAHDWNCARERKKLPADPQPPDSGYGLRYKKPPEWLRVVGIDDSDEAWVVERGWILTDYPSPLPAIGIVMIENPAELDANGAEAIAKRLAATCAARLTSGQSSGTKLFKEYEQILQEARGVDGQEGRPKNDRLGEWERAKF